MEYKWKINGTPVPDVVTGRINSQGIAHGGKYPIKDIIYYPGGIKVLVENSDNELRSADPGCFNETAGIFPDIFDNFLDTGIYAPKPE